MKKSISKLFDNSKLNNMDKIIGGDNTGRASDTVYGSSYDVYAATYKEVKNGGNGGYVGDVEDTGTGTADQP